MKRLSLILLGVFALALPVGAQTITSSTTLNGAITSSATSLVLTSATGVTVSPQTDLYIDQELMRVIGNPGASTTFTVQRGQGGTGATSHNTLQPVWLGTPAQFGLQGLPVSNGPTPTLSGQCQASLVQYLPVIDVRTGFMYDCLGVTTAGQWTRTNVPGFPVLGSTVASPAGVMTPTGTIFTVSGTNAITGITVPNGWIAGMSIYVIPSGTFTWTTATNIALLGTAFVNKMIIFTWSGTKWVPSVVA